MEKVEPVVGVSMEEGKSEISSDNGTAAEPSSLDQKDVEEKLDVLTVEEATGKVSHQTELVYSQNIEKRKLQFLETTQQAHFV
ncbi:unnamed protein product [Cuscuta campestris]|uniref:Uncharacterized protein n=1 Tax=Cuscuta campestris TaxID=132261 RepID=A0A484NGZ9_9ASTE|nr:unnamed protein product [Cuscuta campestris]